MEKVYEGKKNIIFQQTNYRLWKALHTQFPILDVSFGEKNMGSEKVQLERAET